MDSKQRVQDFISNLKWRDLPEQVRHQSKRCLLDTLGALISGTRTPVAELMAAFALEQYPGKETTIFAGGSRCSAVGAALANGFSGNALDIDDGYRMVKGHPGACILPVILAACETAHSCSGEEFLTALVVGYELGIRAGVIRHALYPTYHASGSWGALAGAAAAGRLLGLDAETIWQAMGAAEYHAPIAPMMKGIDVPAMVKDAIGWGCMVAMASVLMARKGFTGIEPLFGDGPDEDWIAGIGTRYEILNLYFKPYAACRWAQPAVAGALKLAAEHGLRKEEILSIKVRTFSAAAALSRAHPKNTEEAQYNLSFPVAAALTDGEVGPRQVLPPRMLSGDLLLLADKVEVEVEDQYEQAFPAKARAEVVIHTTDGRILRSGTMEAIWEPPDTLPTDEELRKKFFWLVEPVLGGERTRELEALIWNFEREGDARVLPGKCVR